MKTSFAITLISAATVFGHAFALKHAGHHERNKQSFESPAAQGWQQWNPSTTSTSSSLFPAPTLAPESTTTHFVTALPSSTTTPVIVAPATNLATSTETSILTDVCSAATSTTQAVVVVTNLATTTPATTPVAAVSTFSASVAGIYTNATEVYNCSSSTVAAAVTSTISLSYVTNPATTSTTFISSTTAEFAIPTEVATSSTPVSTIPVAPAAFNSANSEHSGARFAVMGGIAVLALVYGLTEHL